MEIGSKAPEFSLIGKDGMVYDFTYFKGVRGIIVAFVESATPWLDRVMSYLENLYNEYHSKSISVLMIDVNDQLYHPPSEHQKRGVVHLWDFFTSTSDKYGVEYIPQAFLLNSKKYIIYKGFVDTDGRRKDTLKRALDEYIDFKHISNPIYHPNNTLSLL